MYQSVAALGVFFLTVETLVGLKFEMYGGDMAGKGGGGTVGLVAVFTLHCVLWDPCRRALVSV